jgi:hypothetical protein
MSDAPSFRGRPISPEPLTQLRDTDAFYKTTQRPERDEKAKVAIMGQKHSVPPKLEDLPTLEVSIFPINLVVAGTNSGDFIDLVTLQKSTTKSSNSMNYRQYVLQVIRPRGGDVVKLVAEPDNPYDPNAIKVTVELHGEWVCIGYIPAKPKEAPGVSFLSNVDILALMSNPLYVTGWVTHKEGVETLGYRIVIKDHYL